LVASSSVPSTSSPIFSPTSNSSFNYCGSNTGGGNILARNSTKTLKCPKCNWHYKYQETLEIHMKEKHADQEVNKKGKNNYLFIFKGFMSLLFGKSNTSKTCQRRNIFLRL